MFSPGSWAKAFVNSVEKAGGETKDGMDTLAVFVPWVKSLPGEHSGRARAKKLELLIRDGVSTLGAISLSGEIAARFLLLMVRKNTFRYIDLITKEITKIMNRKQGIIAASLEYSSPPDEEVKSLVREAVKNKTGAAGVELEECYSPALIGGYRLKIGDTIIDASIRSQLQKLKAALESGPAWNGGD